jgi:hypothetical protein
MRLFKDLIDKKIEQYQEFQNIRHYLISAWNLHIAYLVCLNFSEFRDSHLKEKNELFYKIFTKIANSEYKEVETILHRINNFADEELKIINDALSKMQLKTELLNELGDINPERYRNHGFIAVSSFDAP